MADRDLHSKTLDRLGREGGWAEIRYGGIVGDEFFPAREVVELFRDVEGVPDSILVVDGVIYQIVVEGRDMDQILSGG